MSLLELFSILSVIIYLKKVLGISSCLTNYQSMRSSGNFMVMIGYIFGIVGFITSIAGIFAPAEEQMKKVIIGEGKNNHICSTTGLEKSKGTQVEEVVKYDDETKENTNVLEYCFQCGEKIEGTPKFCYKCGVKLREGARFCENCGISVKSSSDKGEKTREEIEGEIREKIERELKEKEDKEFRKRKEKEIRNEVERKYQDNKKIDLQSYFKVKLDKTEIKKVAVISTFFPVAIMCITILIGSLSMIIFSNTSAYDIDFGFPLSWFYIAGKYSSLEMGVSNWFNLIVNFILFLGIIFFLTYIYETINKNRKILSNRISTNV